VSAHLLSRGSNREYETLNLTTALPGSIWVSLKLNIYPRRAEGEDHDFRERSEAKIEVKIRKSPLRGKFKEADEVR